MLDPSTPTVPQQLVLDWAASRTGGRTAFAISVDRLGVANDVLGQRAGDLILRTCADRITEWVGSSGLVASAGGARFVAVRTDLPARDEALHAAEQLRALLAEPVDVDGLLVSRSASIGVAVDALGSSDPVHLVVRAVHSAAAARSTGGDGVWEYDHDAATAHLNRQRLELELPDALATNQLRVHYQPERDLRTGRIAAVEALLRWQHPRLGFLGADAFVPAVEQTHTFANVQCWVIDEACRQLAQWSAELAADDVVLRLNISARHVVLDAITGVLLAALERHRLAGARLCIEITERRMPSDLVRLTEQLTRWRHHGMSVALDDFGTGEGTLSHLLALPLDIIKIDQVFVSRMTTDQRAEAVVANTIALARTLELDVVAEGVDGPQTALALVRLGCLRGQGNALGEAMAPDDLAALLQAQHESGLPR